MPLYRPSELRQFLATLGVSPRKSLSQNFLIDGNILRKITDLANVKAGDRVIEIGPGPGALTEHLLQLGCFVTAIEKDRLFAQSLLRLAPDNSHLTVLSDDVMKVDFSSVANGLSPLLLLYKIKVTANIPYHLTTPIIKSSKMDPLLQRRFSWFRRKLQGVVLLSKARKIIAL